MSTLSATNINIFKNFNIPYYTSSQRTNLSSKQVGEIILNTDLGKVEFWNGSTWVETSVLPDLFDDFKNSYPSWVLSGQGSKPSSYYGIDSTGHFITGNAFGTSSYPTRSDGLEIPSDISVVVRFSINKNHVCADHGIAFYRSDATPSWTWGNNSSRHAFQWNCYYPYIYPASGGSTYISYLPTQQNYSNQVIYVPSTGTLNVKIWSGANTYSGTPLAEGTNTNCQFANLQGSADTYEVAFDADQDSTSNNSYFWDISIKAFDGGVGDEPGPP